MEQTFSRFRDDSELSRLNRAEGPFRASAELASATARALMYETLTGGLFDAHVGAAMIDNGYDKSFAPGALDRTDAARGSAPIAAPPATAPRCQVDVRARRIARPGSVRLDLGGMIKGYAVDCARALLPDTAAVDAGGDAFLKGPGPEGEGWIVDVEDPRDASRTLLSFRVSDRGVATSASNRRTWKVAGKAAHHLLDPRTGAPAASGLAQVTAVARSTELADVLAKAAFVAGRERGAALLTSAGAAGVLVGADGSLHVVGDLDVLAPAQPGTTPVFACSSCEDRRSELIASEHLALGPSAERTNREVYRG